MNRRSESHTAPKAFRADTARLSPAGVATFRRFGASTVRRQAFTLVEMLCVIIIITMLVSIVTLLFRHIRQTGMLAEARNAIVIYTQTARIYALTHQTETMLVVNPYNGRFEIWYKNMPQQGGAWDPMSSGVPNNPNDADDPERRFTGGYAFAPVLDSDARLPVDGDGFPLVVVHPIDYDNRPAAPSRPTGTVNDPDMNNLIWAAVCFDPNGRLVIRTRRIANRLYYVWDDQTLYPERNLIMRTNADRLPTGEPDPGHQPSVTGGTDGDTPITSTTGFIVSDRGRMIDRLRERLPITPQTLVNEWLTYTTPLMPRGSNVSDTERNISTFTTTILFNRFSGQQMAGAL